MKKEYRWAAGPIRTAAFLLAVISLLTLLLSGGTVAICVATDAYSRDNSTIVQDYIRDMADSVAYDIASYHAQELYAPEENFYYNDVWNFYFHGEYTNYRFAIHQQGEYNGELLKTNYNGGMVRYSFSTEVTPGYVTWEEQPDSYEYLDGSIIANTVMKEVYRSVDETWIVTSYILEDTEFADRFSLAYEVLTTAFSLKIAAIWALGISFLIFVLSVIYLFFAAGHRPGCEEIQPGVLDRVFLEFWLAAPIGLGAGLFILLDEVLRYWEHSLARYELILLGVSVCALIVLLVVALLGLAVTVAVRLKKREGYIWRQTLVFRVLKGLCWLIKKLWHLVKLAARGLGRLFRMLPLMWQWLAISLALGILLVLGIWGESVFLLIQAALLWLGLTVYYAFGFGTLQKTLRRMAAGDLDSRVELRGIYGNFRLVARDINAISTQAEAEVDRRMRSERMKTELITNVSHDIKTPLTSIVNYVDLLQKEHTPAEEQEYLDVLARQSQRLKKLTEDLVEMSKASSGNLSVALEAVGISELIQQAMAEYEGKLEQADLHTVKRLPEKELFAQADGKLLWRVMDNLLSNCVKYALPGTRVYVDVWQKEDAVAVSVKNISREPLEISPEELMERFVRGDRSRNTEGSGLGLNIATSLMELQKGKLEVNVDGDLFKVVLTLPKESS